jgi:hypothetical protein
MLSRTPQSPYDYKELASARRHEQEVDTSPLAERKAGQADFLEVMKKRPEVVAERIDWLLAGNYGSGEMMMARNLTPRMNRPAILSQLIAVFEWHCPRRMAVDAWKKLTAKQKATLDSHIEDVLHAYDTEDR